MVVTDRVLEGEGSRPLASPAGGARRLAAKIRRRLGPYRERPGWPLVSIVVPSHDGAALLRRLLVGLVEQTDYPSLELIVVDNASSDDSLELLRTAEVPFPISILANFHNESFSDACNQGAAIASGELLLFLNNDAQPFEVGWLRELVACLLDSGAGAVGPILIAPDEDGGLAEYRVDQRGLRLRDLQGRFAPDYCDRGADPLGEGLGEDCETMAVAGACLLVCRATFERVGGFTHGYWYGPEDVDLALKLRERGLAILCSGRSLLIHPPGSTLKTLESGRRGVAGNRRFFMERWGPRVRREYELDLLDGCGVWAAPSGAGRHTRAELEALGYCLRASDPTAAPPRLLEEIRASLERRGRRCLVLVGDRVEDLAGLDYDIAVHLKGSTRYILKRGQLNVLWTLGRIEDLDATERSSYDLVVAGSEPDRFAASLVTAVAAHAAEIGYRPRIERDPAVGSR